MACHRQNSNLSSTLVSLNEEIQFTTLNAGESRISLAVQWLRLQVPNAGGTGGRTKIPHATQHGQKNKAKHK